MRHGPRSTVPADGRALAKLIQASAATQARVRAGLRCHGATSQSEISELDAGFSFRVYMPAQGQRASRTIYYRVTA
jgi:hypothetical protein